MTTGSVVESTNEWDKDETSESVGCETSRYKRMRRTGLCVGEMARGLSQGKGGEIRRLTAAEGYS